MGLCESENFSPNLVRMDEEIKNVSTDYLFEYSIHEKIKKNYKLNAKIGEGGFGKVFIGKDKLGKKYAIKRLPKKKFLKGRFQPNEIKMVKRLNHKNILSIKEVYEDMHKISLVMEYCEGGDLFDFITKSPEGKLDDKTTIDIITQILDAVNYLHNEVKICHRDLKPENCLFKANNAKKPLIKIIDFGTCHFIDKNNKITGKVGTLKYMAPEIFTKPFYNEKVDIWSVGIILYNMITGREPFALDTKEYKAHQVSNHEINFDLIKNDDIREFCQELLEKNPNKRIDARNAFEKAKIIKKKYEQNLTNIK